VTARRTRPESRRLRWPSPGTTTFVAPSAGGRSRAADALGKIGGPRVIEAVLQLVRDKDDDIRRAAIEILNQTKDERAVDSLIQATRDSDWCVSDRAVDALAEIGSMRGLPRLAEMLPAGQSKALPIVVRANGELAAAMQYSIQGLNCDDPDRKDLLMDIGTEELSHLEIVGTLARMHLKPMKGERDAAEVLLQQY